MKTKALVSLVLLWTVAVSAAPQAPKRLDEIVPADTLLYVSIPDVARAREALKTTALADIWREPEVQDAVHTLVKPLWRVYWDMAADLAEREDPGVPVVKGLDVQAIGKGIGRCLDGKSGLARLDGEISLAVLPPPPEVKIPTVLVVLEGPVADRAQRLLFLAREKLPVHFEEFESGDARGAWFLNRENQIEAGWARTENRLLIAFGSRGTAERWLIGHGTPVAEPLARSPDYRALQARWDAKGAPIAHAYLNLARTREKILESLPDPAARATVPLVLSALGLDGVRAAGTSIAVREKGFVRSTVLLAPGEKKGLLAAFAGPSKGEFKGLAFVPAGTHSFYAGRIDPKQAWRAVQDAVRTGAGEAGLFSMREKMAEDLPPELLRDLPGVLGGEIGVSLKQQIGVMPIPEITLFVELADEAAARRLVGDLLARGAEEQGFKVQSLPAVGTGPAVTTVTFPDIPFLPAFAIHKGWLIAALTPTAVRAACRRIDSPDPAKGISATDDFKAAFSRVARPGSFLAYEEGPDSFRKQYNQLVGILPMLQMGLEQAAGKGGPAFPEIDLAALPMADTIARHLFGSAQAAGADADGFYAESFGVAPVNLADVAGIGILAAIAIPSMAKARGQAALDMEEDDPLAAVFDRKDEGKRLSVEEISALKGVRAATEAAAVYKKLLLCDADGDGIGEYPSAQGKGWQGVVDTEGNFLLPFCETDGVYKKYRYAIYTGRDPERTFYVMAVPVAFGGKTARVFVGDSRGFLYEADRLIEWRQIENYLAEDGGPGHPPKPFVPVDE